MKSLDIYLAGAMSGLSFEDMNSWRELLKVTLKKVSDFAGCQINVTNPVDYYNFKEKKHQNEREVMQFDLNKVKSSDLIIVNVVKLNNSIGTAIELYEASKRDIPIIAYNPNGEIDYNTIHPWLQCYISRVEEHAFVLSEYVRDFYMK